MVLLSSSSSESSFALVRLSLSRWGIFSLAPRRCGVADTRASQYERARQGVRANNQTELSSNEPLTFDTDSPSLPLFPCDPYYYSVNVDSKWDVNVFLSNLTLTLTRGTRTSFRVALFLVFCSPMATLTRTRAVNWQQGSARRTKIVRRPRYLLVCHTHCKGSQTLR